MTLLRQWDESVGIQEPAKSLNSLRISVMLVQARGSSCMYSVPTAFYSARPQ